MGRHHYGDGLSTASYKHVYSCNSFGGGTGGECEWFRALRKVSWDKPKWAAEPPAEEFAAEFHS